MLARPATTTRPLAPKRSASPAAPRRPMATPAAAAAASSSAASEALLAAPRRQIAGTPLADPSHGRADDVAAACAAVRIASVLCRSVQRALREEDRRDKDDASPVTAADYAAQAAVAWALRRAALPGDKGALSMVAEEDSEDLRWVCLFLDPLLLLLATAASRAQPPAQPPPPPPTQKNLPTPPP